MSQKSEYFAKSIKWEKGSSAEYPFRASINEETLVIRINDFPEEEMYTLLVDGNKICDFTIWPSRWQKPHTKQVKLDR